MRRYNQCANLGYIHLGVVYTMDYEDVPGPCKSVDWLLNSSRETKEKKCQSDRGGWGPQKTYFKAYIIHWHDSTGFAVREAKEVV